MSCGFRRNGKPCIGMDPKIESYGARFTQVITAFLNPSMVGIPPQRRHFPA